MSETKLSIILPAKNEAAGLAQILPHLKQQFPDSEIIVVNDGSTDDTAKAASAHAARLVTHPYSMGNGAAVKSGARNASGDLLLFMDADGQHDSEDIQPLLEKLEQGYDMVVGERNSESQASIFRALANRIYSLLASWMAGSNVKDLTSGFRIVKAEKFREFLYLLPNGFSYPTTITMAFLRAGYSVGYVPITARKRLGKSHISLLRDGVRFFLIIFRVGTLYSPLKLFFPISAFFLVAGLTYYAYTYFAEQRFTNMGALLLTTAIIIFLIGIVSEQITNLLYNRFSK